MDYINKDKIIGAKIVEPNTNTGESWDISETHGYRLSLTIGFSEGKPMTTIIEGGTRKYLENLAKELGLNEI